MSEYSSSQESLIDSFIAITGVDKERAAFFLQSAAWNLDVRDSSVHSSLKN